MNIIPALVHTTHTLYQPTLTSTAHTHTQRERGRERERERVVETLSQPSHSMLRHAWNAINFRAKTNSANQPQRLAAVTP